MERGFRFHFGRKDVLIDVRVAIIKKLGTLQVEKNLRKIPLMNHTDRMKQNGKNQKTGGRHFSACRCGRAAARWFCSYNAVSAKGRTCICGLDRRSSRKGTGSWRQRAWRSKVRWRCTWHAIWRFGDLRAAGASSRAPCAKIREARRERAPRCGQGLFRQDEMMNYRQSAQHLISCGEASEMGRHRQCAQDVFHEPVARCGGCDVLACVRLSCWRNDFWNRGTQERTEADFGDWQCLCGKGRHWIWLCQCHSTLGIWNELLTFGAFFVNFLYLCGG